MLLPHAHTHTEKRIESELPPDSANRPSAEVTFEQRPERNEGGTMWISRSWNSKCRLGMFHKQ